MPNPLSLAKTALTPSLLQTVRHNLPMAGMYTTLGLGLKGIGSVFRVNDLHNAPQSVQNARIHQESALLATAGMVTLMVQSVLPLVFHRFNIRSDVGQNLIRSAMIAPGYIVSESISRRFGDVSWDKMMASQKPAEDPTSRTLLRQLTDFLFQPNAPHQPAQAFGQMAYNPYNRASSNYSGVSPLTSTPAMVGQRLNVTSSPVPETATVNTTATPYASSLLPFTGQKPLQNPTSWPARSASSLQV